MKKYFIVCIVLSGCVKSNPFSDPGDPVIISRKLDAFVQVNLSDKINMIIHPAATDSIMIEGPSKFANSVRAEVSNNQVFISSELAGGMQRPDFDVTVHLYTRSLSNINYQGAGVVSCSDTIRTNYFNFFGSKATGNVSLNLACIFAHIDIESDMADLKISGRADSAYAHCSTLASMDFRDFEVRRLEIDQASLRPAYVYATESLRARIWFKGDVIYRGSPVLSVQTHDAGRLRPL